MSASSRLDPGILFLDFDGVLHPISASGAELFARRPLLEEVLREVESIRVVISSAWRETHPIEEMREYFAPDIRPRIVDVTPVLLTSSRLPPGLEGYLRHCECVTWLRRSRLHATPWLAIDDQQSFFSPECENLLLTDGTTGLTETDAARLRRRLLAMQR